MISLGKRLSQGLIEPRVGRAIEGHSHWCRAIDPLDPKQAKLQGQKGLSQVGARLKRSTLVPSGPNDPEPPQDMGASPHWKSGMFCQ